MSHDYWSKCKAWVMEHKVPSLIIAIVLLAIILSVIDGTG